MSEKTLGLPAPSKTAPSGPLPAGKVIKSANSEALVVMLFTDKELPWDARNWTYDQREKIVKAFEEVGFITGPIWTTGHWRRDRPGVPYMLYAQTERHPQMVATTIDELRRSLGEDRLA